MLIVYLLLPIGLFVSVANAQFGQGVARTSEEYGTVGQASVGEGYAAMGQAASDSNRQAQPVGNLQNQVVYAGNDKSVPQSGYGQGLPNAGVRTDVNYGQGNQQQYGQPTQRFGQGFSSPQQNAQYGVGAGQYPQGNSGQSLPTLDRGYRNSRSPSLGQPSAGLGQGVEPSSVLGQHLMNSPSLGQPAQPHGGLGQRSNPEIGQLRAKRYSNREPYRKSCNSYYGKYICYRLYESDTGIPNDFTCWSTYLGKKNCTETENVLYLDRRNVEVDPTEVDRVFKTDDRPTHYAPANRERSRTRDDEFGAIEKNMHGRRYKQRRLPSESEDQNVRVYDDRELRGPQRS